MDLKKPASQTTGGGVAVGKTLIVGNLTAGVEKALPHGFTNFTDMQLEAKDDDNNQLVDLLWHDTTNVYIRASVDVPASANLVVSCIPYKYASVVAPAATATSDITSAVVNTATADITITGVNTNFQVGDTIAVTGGSAINPITASAINVVSTTEITCTLNFDAASEIGVYSINITSSPNVSIPFSLTAVPPATITLTPNSVPTGGMQIIVIDGTDTHFSAIAPVSGVTIEGTPVNPIDVIINSAVKITIMKVFGISSVGANSVVVTTGTEVTTPAILTVTAP